MGEKFVIGQTFACGVGGTHLGQRSGFMRLAHSILPIGPSCALYLRGINPFGQIGYQRHRRACGPHHGFLRNPCGQWVDWFKFWYHVQFFWGDHVFGVHHLGDPVE